MKRLLPAILLFIVSFNSHAQLYDWAIGVRAAVSSSYGLTGKFFLNGEGAIETYIHRLNQDFYRISGLYEHHFDGGRNIHVYVGGGATFTYRNDDVFTTRTGGGLDAILGVEYVSDWAPLAIGVDYKPGVNLFGPKTNNNVFLWTELGVNLRITIGS